MEEQFIGRYKIIEQIGAGGMAKVYLGVHKDVPSLRVILKVLTDPRLADRFIQEADKMALLDGHPNVCSIRHFFSHGEDTVIVMDFINGATLEEIVDKENRMTVPEALRVIDDVLDTLSFAHKKGISHRDIKPNNIMIDKSGKVKIIDFGIAKGESDPQLTAAGMACGTPAYMAPEQFTPSADTNYTLVDIYAVGTTLFRLLTGECPFKGDNEFAIRDCKMFNEPPSPRKLNPDIPKPLEKIILKSLQKDPSKRFATADEMKQALKEAGAGISPKAPTEDKTVAFRSRKHSKPAGNKMKSVLIGLGGTIVLALLVFGISRLLTSEDIADGNITKADTGSSAIDPGVLARDTLITPASSVPATGEIALKVTPMADAVYLADSLVAEHTSEVSITHDTGTFVLRLERSGAANSPIIEELTIRPDAYIERSYGFTTPPQRDDTPVRTPTLTTLIVASRPRGANIILDGKETHKPTPFSFEVEIGQHIVRLELDYFDRLLQHTDTISVNDSLTYYHEFDI